MAVEQKNFSFFEYEADDDTMWNVRGEDGGAFAGVDGHTTDYTNPVFGTVNKRRHPRYVVAQDATTFRIVKGIVYTKAAYAAITPGQAITVAVPGSATEVTYNVSAKIPEKMPLAKASRHLADHA